jgi:exonuclease SbcC
VDQAQRLADGAQKKSADASQEAGLLEGLRLQQEKELAEKCRELLDCGVEELVRRLPEEILRNREAIGENTRQRELLERQDRQRRLLEQGLPAQEKKIGDLTERQSENVRAAAALEARIQSRREQMETAAAGLPYPTEQELLEQIRTRKREQSVLEQALSKARDRHRDVLEKLSTLKGSIEALEKELAGSEPVEAVRIGEELDQVSGALGKLHRDHTAASIRIHANGESLTAIDATDAELKVLEQQLKWLDPLAKTANGDVNGKEKLKLETFVQTTYLDRILVCANTRLLRMSDGQYEMARHTDPEDKQGQKGLDLDVIDHYNGSRRSVRTLSGGESFKASLALALGMSEMIQRQAGGIRFDTMFVDEGFGSLDEESLRTAINTLAELSDSNRLVGIISHVGELKERIDKQIRVKKTREGSSEAKIILE